MEKLRREYQENNAYLIRDFENAVIRRDWSRPVWRKAVNALKRYSGIISQLYAQEGSLQTLQSLEGIGNDSIKLLRELLIKGSDRVYEDEFRERMQRRRDEVWNRRVDGLDAEIHLRDEDTEILEEKGYVSNAPDLGRLLEQLR